MYFGFWFMCLVGFGECLFYEDNVVSLNKDVLDKYGLFILYISVIFWENEKVMWDDIVIIVFEMLEVVGGKDI